MTPVRASFKLDREYFQLYYRDWLLNVARWKLLLLPAAISLSIVGLIGLFVFRDFSVFFGVLTGIGLIETIDFSTRKLRWIRTASNISDFDSKVSATFSDEGMHIVTTNADSQLKWAGFSSYTVTPNGLFLKPDKRNAIYIPDYAWGDSHAKTLVLARLKETEQGATANP